MNGPAPTPRGDRLALLVPVAFAAFVAVCVAGAVSGKIPFDSDEANHANLGLRQFQDLRDGRIADFLRHSYRTGQFPFLHGWTLVPWFALLGPTYHAARVAQCAAFVVGAAATGYAAYRMSGDRRAGAVAASLFAASPLLAALSSVCMLEVPGAAATAFALAVFAEACREDRRRPLLFHAAVGVAALATFFVKLNYGIWLVPALAVGYGVRALRATDRRAALRDLAVYGGVVVAVLLAWYSTAGQRAAFMGFLHNPSQAVSVERDDPSFAMPGFRPENFTAYFGLVAVDYHVHWTIGAAVFAFAIVGALRLHRDAGVAAAAACLGSTWLVLSMGFREYPLARFIATAMPALFVLAGVGVARSLPRGPAWLPAAGAAALAVAAGAQAGWMPARLAAEYEVGEEFAPAIEFAVGAVPPHASVLAVGYTDHVSARTIEWRLGARPGAAFRDVNVVGLNSERIFESDRRLGEWMTAPRPWGDADWASYVIEFRPGPDYADRDLVVPATAAMWRDALAKFAPRLEQVASRRFEGIDLDVIVWRDTAPPPHRGLATPR